MVLHVHRKIVKALLALIVSVMVISAFPVGGVCAAGEEITLSASFEATSKKLIAIGDSASWRDDTAWIVFSLARAGMLPATGADQFYEAVKAQVTERESARLSDTESTVNARTILALTSAGFDPSDIEGYNLLEPLADPGYINRQGINGPIWALIALDSGHFDIPENTSNPNAQTTRQVLVNTILNTQLTSSGVKTGWTYSGRTADVDMTCMALTALAPYYEPNNDEKADVNQAVDAALVWLSSAQKETGCFSSGDPVSSESSSQAIVALTSLGINPREDSRFLKKEKSGLHGLLSFYVAGGGFRHISTNVKMNNLASIQAFYAMTAYYRFLDGANTLYDMTDSQDGYQVVTAGKEDVVWAAAPPAVVSPKPSSAASGSKPASVKPKSSKTKTSKAKASKTSTSKKKTSSTKKPAAKTSSAQRTTPARQVTSTTGRYTSPYSSSAGTYTPYRQNSSQNPTIRRPSVSSDRQDDSGQDDEDDESVSDLPEESSETADAVFPDPPEIDQVRSMHKAIPWVILGILAIGGLAAILIIKRKVLPHE